MCVGIVGGAAWKNADAKEKEREVNQRNRTPGTLGAKDGGAERIRTDDPHNAIVKMIT
jgi:hypothetical protein